MANKRIDEIANIVDDAIGCGCCSGASSKEVMDIVNQALREARAEGIEGDPFYALRYHGCLTGDCPHDFQWDCNASLLKALRGASDERDKAASGEEVRDAD